MEELENALLFTPKFLVERGYKNRPAFRDGNLPGRRVNGYKADSFRHIAGNFRPYKILTKVTSLSFELVTSDNYALLRSAIDVLETLQEVFSVALFAQKTRHVSLDVRPIVSNDIHNTFFSFLDSG
ncbi:hypothetical protein TNCV_297481 [Trichonephila clavipes]|nr:hypothetical protein TNCV_297481 [Trichonephila clavipes]